jgi:hypothetical protein
MLSWLTWVDVDGACGVAGTVVTSLVAAEDGTDVPAAFDAVTEIEYSAALERPDTVIGEEVPVAVPVDLPSDTAVTV